MALGLCALAIAGSFQLKLGHDYRLFLDANDVELREFDKITQEVADGRDTLTIIYRPANGDVFESTSMLQLAKVADLASRFTHVSNVQSLVTARKLVRIADAPAEASDRDAYRVVPLIYPDGLFDDAGLKRLRADVASMPSVYGRLVARDMASASIILPIDLGGDAETRTSRLADLRRSIAALETDIQGLRADDSLVLVGPALFDAAVSEILLNDVRTLAPLALGLFFCLLFLLFRSLYLAGIVLFVVLLSCGAALGIVAWAGMQTTILVFSGLILVATLSVAEALHVITAATLARLEGQDGESGMVHSLDVNLWAITTTSLTTAVGEAVLLFSSSPAVRNMGIVMIVGAIVALLLTVAICPALTVLQKKPRKGLAGSMGDGLDRLATFCATRPRLVLTSCLALIAAILPGLTLLHGYDTMSGWFTQRTEFRRGLDLLSENYVSLGAITAITRVEDADREAAAIWPAPSGLVSRQSALDEGLSKIPGVQSVITAMSAKSAFQSRLPAPATSLSLSQAAVAEAPVSAAPGPSMLEQANLATAFQTEKSSWLIRTVDVGIVSNAQLIGVADQVRGQTARLEDRTSHVGGLPVVFAALGQSNQKNVVQGTFLTVLAITLCLAVALQSVRGALISLIPNVLPVAIVFGAWGWISGEINLAATTVISVALGIVVDDTTHIMMKHRRLRAHGYSAMEASRLTVIQAGAPILVTTIVLATGFVILGFSDFALTSQQSLLIAACIAVAVIFDLTATPVLLTLGERLKKPRLAES